MLRTAELDMANSVIPDDVDVFLDNATGAICSIYHTALNASPGAAIFGRNMLFNIPFVADWHIIGEHRQSLTDRGNQRKNAKRIYYDYKVGNKVLLIKTGFHPVWYRILGYCCKNYFSSVQHLYIIFSLTILYRRSGH
jgi:hypothetical protein